MNGGDAIADVLAAQGVGALFTLCGGHISPILVAAKKRGLRVIDTRHEATAVFAADATARLTGTPGVAAVTAGPGVTNTITALKNAQLAQSPLVLIGGATATVLKRRGALQDIDQMALVRPHVKLATSVRRVKDLAPAVERAFAVAREGVPGPVFVECPVDLLYDERVVREWYSAKSAAKSLPERLQQWYLARHVDGLFAGARARTPSAKAAPPVERADASAVASTAARLRKATRPVLLVGSQAVAGPVAEVAAAVRTLGIPVYLSGTARGLLGATDALQLRHRRKEALREADVAILAGVPCDFRLDYGRHLGRETALVSVNRSREDVAKNRRPKIAVVGDPGRFLAALARELGGIDRTAWRDKLRARDAERDAEIAEQERAAEPGFVNPLALCRAIDGALEDDAILVADGGDFVATASYVVRPRGPLGWLDPGVFGTLGVGAGFALGAAVARPGAPVWVLFGDGSLGYSLAEFDTFARHGIPVVAVVGNDACWSQIRRDQVEILKDDVACMLRHTDYHAAAEALGGRGFLLKDPAQAAGVLSEARQAARDGRAILVNAHIARTEFRKGSLSI